MNSNTGSLDWRSLDYRWMVRYLQRTVEEVQIVADLADARVKDDAQDTLEVLQAMLAQWRAWEADPELHQSQGLLSMISHTSQMTSPDTHPNAQNQTSKP